MKTPDGFAVPQRPPGLARLLLPAVGGEPGLPEDHFGESECMQFAKTQNA